MSGNLIQLEKALRKIAKHSKTIKYTKGLLFAFIMMGMSAFSAEVTIKDKEIEQTKTEINDTVKDLKEQFRIARAENDKLLRNANIDLIQLMEQGDQVIKSPWSSWQFGINYFLDDWDNNYKGYGDKKEKYPYGGIYERSSDLSVRGLSPTTKAYAEYMLTNSTFSTESAINAARQSSRYGLVGTNTPIKNSVPYDVNAAITPRVINIQPLALSAPASPTGVGPAIPNVKIPNFNPAAPSVITPDLPAPPTFAIILGADCNTFCSTGHQTAINPLTGYMLQYTWENNRPATGEMLYAFRMGYDEGTGALTIPHIGVMNFNSFNISTEWTNPILASQGTNHNNQRFFVGGSRFIEWDNAVGPVNLGDGSTLSTLNLSGPLTLGMVSQQQQQTLNITKNTIVTDELENIDPYIMATPDNYLLNGTNNNIYKLKNTDYTTDGYVGYKVGQALVQENNRGSVDIINRGVIDFRGYNSIGQYIFLYNHNPNDSKIINEGEILISGYGSYGMKYAANGRTSTANISNVLNNGTITLRKNPGKKVDGVTDGTDKADESAAMALMEDAGVVSNVYLAKGKVLNKGIINIQDNVQNSTGMYVNVVNSNVINEGTINVQPEVKDVTSGSQPLNVGMRADQGSILANGNGNTEVINSGNINVKGKHNIGMLANGNNNTGIAQAINEVTKIINISSGSSLSGIDSLNGGNIENKGEINILSTAKNSIGIYVENGSTGTGTGNITVTGDGNTAIANFGTFTQTGGTIDVSGKDSIGIYAKDATSDTLIKNSIVNAKDGAVAFYADGSVGNESTIKIDGVTSNIGDGGLLFFNYTGTGTGQVGKFNILSSGMTANILSGGVAFYNRGNIGSEANFLNMITGNLTLDMKPGSRLFVFDDPGITQNLSTIPTSVVGTSVSNASGTGTINIIGSDYKYTTENKATLNIDQNVNLDQVGDSYYKVDFFSSNVNVGIPSSSIMTNNGNPIANSLKYAIAQKNSGTTASSVTVDVKPTGQIRLTNQTGLLGVITDKGTIINNGIVESSGESGIGLLGANGSIVTNNSSIIIGNNGTGIMGVNSLPSGVSGDIDLVNNGTISYAPTSSAILPSYGIVAKNIGSTSKVTLGSGSLIDLSNNQESVGVYASNSNIVDNGGDIKVGVKGIGMQLVNPLSMTTAGGTITGSSTSTEAIGIYIESGASTLQTSKNVTLMGDKSVGVYINDTLGSMNYTNTGTITIGNALLQSNPSVGIYSNAQSMTEQGNITVGDNAIGLYSSKIGSTVKLDTSGMISVGENGTGIYKLGGTLQIDGTLKALGNNSVGAYVEGGMVTNNSTSLVIGSSAYGIVGTAGTGTTNITNNSSNVTIGDNSVFIYSSDTAGTITNNANLTSASNKLYGLYGSGTIVNNNTIDYSAGIGNIGIYTNNGGNATNNSTITIGSSDASTSSYGIAMVADSGSTAKNSSTGIINVSGNRAVGMYASGIGSKAVNDGTINLNQSGTIGMYIEKDAEGINNGLITTTGSGTNTVTGVALKSGGQLTNNGTINIDTNNGSGILNSGGVIANYGTITVSGTDTVVERVPNASTASAGGGSVNITVGGMSSPTPGVVTITSAGVPVTPVTVTLPSTPMTPTGEQTVAMYVDTSGQRYTTPMLSSSGTALATNLQIGTEAAKYTNAKAIKIDDPNIILPYSTTSWKEVTSSSLTWVANRGLNSSGSLDSFYLAKLPYTDFASDTNVYNFADGLEQRYDMNALDSREKEVFNKLNGIGNNEEILLYQAYDEMMGHQYANTQQRLYTTSGLLNKEFDYLANEWATASKQSNKVKVFGMKGEYNTDTAGIIDYKNDAYGVAYLHEDETVKLGANTGWYAGVVHNIFKFKDIGGSREETTMGKLGIFKTTTFDNNGSLKWNISGEGMLGYSEMNRRFLVVDEIFGANSTYTSYGLALRNELSKEIRLSERTSLKPYGSIDIEYGRYGKIEEKTGEVRLEVKGNDYYSIKPEVGIEYKYKQPMFVRTNLTASIGIAYENELGKVNDADNKARVAYTNADYFNLRGEKENREGNVKGDLKLGIENSRIGFTLDLGYDTKGENLRGGLGIRVIY